MKNVFRTSIAAVVFAGGLIGMSSAFAVTSTQPYVGELSQPDYFTREITIAPNTRWINVTQGEVVKIVKQDTGQSFVWNFDTYGGLNFDLSAVAPAGMLDQQRVVAYVDEIQSSD